MVRNAGIAALLALAVVMPTHEAAAQNNTLGGALFGGAAGAIVGGALGNAYDRVVYGAVADYLNMSCCTINNPYSFNVADVLIFGGAIVLMWGHEAEARRRK